MQFSEFLQSGGALGGVPSQVPRAVCGVFAALDARLNSDGSGLQSPDLFHLLIVLTSEFHVLGAFACAQGGLRDCGVPSRAPHVSRAGRPSDRLNSFFPTIVSAIIWEFSLVSSSWMLAMTRDGVQNFQTCRLSHKISSARSKTNSKTSKPSAG